MSGNSHELLLENTSQLEMDPAEQVVVDEEPTIAEIVDELGTLRLELSKKMEKLAPLQKRVEFLENYFKHLSEASEPSETVSFIGELYSVELSAKTKKSTVTDKEKMIQLMGEETFVKLAEVGIGKIRQYLTPPEVEQVLKEEYSGSRRLSVEKAMTKPKK